MSIGMGCHAAALGDILVQTGGETMRWIVLIIVLLPALLFAQGETKEDVWAPLRPLIGEWQGTGAEGKSAIEARYEFVLGGQFIEAWHKAVFEPTEAKPDGDVHEDRGFISYDSNWKDFVYRQYHVEGFVNTYVLDSLTSDGKTLVFTAEDVENAPPGTRAQLEITIVGDDEITSSFSVALPGSDLQLYSQNHFKRKK
jgi:hypothetical protein